MPIRSDSKTIPQRSDTTRNLYRPYFPPDPKPPPEALFSQQQKQVPNPSLPNSVEQRGAVIVVINAQAVQPSTLRCRTQQTIFLMETVSLTLIDSQWTTTGTCQLKRLFQIER